MKKAKQRFKLVIAVHLFLRKGNKILLSRRYNTGYRDGEFSVIAGHLDGGEKAKTAMVREAKEEAGIRVALKDLLLIHTMHRKTAVEERIDLFFEAKKWQNQPTIKEPNKCGRMEWFPAGALPKNMVPYVWEAIKNYRRSIIYSEFGWIRPDEK